VTLPDLSNAVTYGPNNLLGPNPVPASTTANWLFTADGKVTFSGRQASVDYQVSIGSPTIAALFLDATFKRITGTEQINGGARIYLDGELIKVVTGSLTNLVVPLHLLSVGTHVIRLELINSQRDYRPVVNSIAVRALASQYDAAALEVPLANAVNRVVTLPTESLTSPAFVEGESLARSSVSLSIPNQGANVPVQEGPDKIWFADIPLKTTPENTAIRLQLGSDQLIVQQQIRWKPTLLEQVSVLTIRKGDALRLQALAAGATAGSLVTYWIGAQQIGSAILGTPLHYDFITAGTFVVTAKVGGVLASGAQTSVTVIEASFGAPSVAANGTTASIQLPLIPTLLTIQGSASLHLTGSRPDLSISPSASGLLCMVARIGVGGPIVAVGRVNVFNWYGTGSNGGGRVIANLSSSRDLINMSYSIDGPIPPNLRIRVTVWIPGTTFLDGSTIAWLTAKDFDEFGVANLQVIYSYEGSPYGQGHGICQHVDFYLAE
jgi:hypothetical protein